MPLNPGLLFLNLKAIYTTLKTILPSFNGTFHGKNYCTVLLNDHGNRICILCHVIVNSQLNRDNLALQCGVLKSFNALGLAFYHI